MPKNIILLLCWMATFCPADLPYDYDQVTMLEKKISIIVYPTEILESVIYRLQLSVGTTFEFNIRVLAPYQAKGTSYKDVSLKQILDHQLAGTPLKYKLKKGKLVLYHSPL